MTSPVPRSLGWIRLRAPLAPTIACEQGLEDADRRGQTVEPLKISQVQLDAIAKVGTESVFGDFDSTRPVPSFADDQARDAFQQEERQRQELFRAEALTTFRCRPAW